VHSKSVTGGAAGSAKQHNQNQKNHKESQRPKTLCRMKKRKVDSNDAIISSASPEVVNHSDANVADKKLEEKAEGGEDLLAKELNKLSLHERNHVYEEIHGVAEVMEETPEFVAERISDLEFSLSRIDMKPAYDRAYFMSPKHVKDLRLMFLRAERFDYRAAAKRMVKYFDLKLELFGLDKLVSPVTLEDLDEYGHAALAAGCLQLPGKDSSGRPIFWDGHLYKKIDNHLSLVGWVKGCWYFIMSVFEGDEGAQRKGGVSVIYNVGQRNIGFTLSPTQMNLGLRFMESLPFRFSATHYCYNDTRIRPLMSGMHFVIGKRGRLRFRSHFGANFLNVSASSLFIYSLSDLI
jgi:hypothetical protein